MPSERRAQGAAERRERRAALTDPGPVMVAAAAFLAVRPRSIGETRRRLRQLGYPEALVDQVVERLAELDYLDDVAFARAWVESRDRARPRGASALRRELALKGVSREIVDDILAERSERATEVEPDRRAAMALIERHRSSLEREDNPVKRRQKAYALLARKGFDPETCREVASHWCLQAR